MASNYVGPGDVIVVTADASYSAGDGVAIGQLFGIALKDAGTGDDLPIQPVGVWDITKTSAQAWAVGDAIYWDDGNQVVTNVDSGIQVGVAVAVAANPSSTGRVRLGLIMQHAYASY